LPLRISIVADPWRSIFSVPSSDPRIATPMNDTIVQDAKTVESGHLKPPQENLNPLEAYL
jgi:hypothetical protein